MKMKTRPLGNLTPLIRPLGLISIMLVGLLSLSYVYSNAGANPVLNVDPLGDYCPSSYYSKEIITALDTPLPLPYGSKNSFYHAKIKNACSIAKYIIRSDTDRCAALKRRINKVCAMSIQISGRSGNRENCASQCAFETHLELRKDIFGEGKIFWPKITFCVSRLKEPGCQEISLEEIILHELAHFAGWDPNVNHAAYKECNIPDYNKHDVEPDRIKLIHESLRSSLLQDALSRGDRQTGEFIEEVAQLAPSSIVKKVETFKQRNDFHRKVNSSRPPWWIVSEAAEVPTDRYRIGGIANAELQIV